MSAAHAAPIPYAETLGATRNGEGWSMAFAPGLIGAPGRLHGGALAGFLELVAIDAVRRAAGEGARLKPVSVTVDFLRAGAMADVFGRAEITRLGRRVANVRATAWQEGPEKPVATAHLNVLIARDDA